MGALAVMTVLRELHITRDTGTVTRAEIPTDILTPPRRGAILMRPDTDTETDHHRVTVMTHIGTDHHTGTVTTCTGTDCHRETVMTHIGTDHHRGREETDTRAYLHHTTGLVLRANLRFLVISFSLFLHLCDGILDWQKNKL